MTPELLKEILKTRLAIADETGNSTEKSLLINLLELTQPKPNGFWILPDFVVEDYECSICGYFSDTTHPFCPNCGTKMIVNTVATTTCEADPVKFAEALEKSAESKDRPVVSCPVQHLTTGEEIREYLMKDDIGKV